MINKLKGTSVLINFSLQHVAIIIRRYKVRIKSTLNEFEN